VSGRALPQRARWARRALSPAAVVSAIGFSFPLVLEFCEQAELPMLEFPYPALGDIVDRDGAQVVQLLPPAPEDGNQPERRVARAPATLLPLVWNTFLRPECPGALVGALY
jgi:hypothetical protein